MLLLFSQIIKCTVYKNVESTIHLCFVTFQKFDLGQVILPVWASFSLSVQWIFVQKKNIS